MSKTLGGTIIIRNNIEFDYCVAEAIECLQALCDEVICLDCGSNDGTTSLVKKYADKSTKVICLEPEQWNEQIGETKLSYFTNLCASYLTTDWHFNLQADECLKEDCFPVIRNAVELDEAEGYFCRRFNLWGNSQHYLDVPDDRKPVGDIVLRLARTGFQSVADAQSLHVDNPDFSLIDAIRIYHLGFVRSKFVHTKKIDYMLTKVFTYGETDPKVAAMNGVFDCWSHFSKEDVKPIIEPLPVFIKKWAAERDKINDVNI